MKLIKYYFIVNKKTVYTLLSCFLALIALIILNDLFISKLIDIASIADDTTLKHLEQLRMITVMLEFVFSVFIAVMIIVNTVLNMIGKKRKILMKHYGKRSYFIYMIVMIIVYSLLLNVINQVEFFIMFINSFYDSNANIEGALDVYKILFLNRNIYFIPFVVIGFVTTCIIGMNIKETISNSKYKYKSKKFRVLQILKIILRYVVLLIIVVITCTSFVLLSPIHNQVSSIVQANYIFNVKVFLIMLLIGQGIVIVDYLRKYLNEIYV